MKIRKAVITAAGRNQRTLPLQTVVDRDGRLKSALQIVVEEAISAGVEEIAVIVCPGDQGAYGQAVQAPQTRLTFIEQPEARGYGHALWFAREFVGRDSFLHLISDHLCLSASDLRCAQQLVQAAGRHDCAVSAVQPARENMLPHYGVIGGTRVPQVDDLYEVERVIEKPTPTEAEQSLVVPGLRAGHYLSLFGLHVLTPMVMELLGSAVEKGGKSVQLSEAFSALAGRERYLALQLHGRRFDIGARYGLLVAQLAFALGGADREEVLAQLVELLAARHYQAHPKRHWRTPCPPP